MQKNRIAIVEDNTTARINLRSHLITMENLEISSYSNGKELRNGLRTKNFEVIFIDFHLGQNKNGVEWAQSLLESEILNPSTSLIFITSDRLPQTIGQILDLHPDMILLKPYTIKSVVTALRKCLAVRSELLPALDFLDKKKPKLALNYIQSRLSNNLKKRFRTDFIKLQGRLFIELKDYDSAIALYRDILEHSNSILWAHWGLIKSEYLAGRWQNCEAMIDSLLSAQLTKEKAFEWLACLAISQQDYEKAERQLDNINDNDLTIQATKLKILAFQMQNKDDEAIELLEKKRLSNFTVKERFDEFTIELARYYLLQAEQVDIDDRLDDLLFAKKLIGNASHFMIDRQSEQQRTYMLAHASLLEGDEDKASRLLEANPYKNDIINKIPTMSDAIKVWFGLGYPDKAKEILLTCETRMAEQNNQIDMVLADFLIQDTESKLGLTKDKAIRHNDQGMQHYLNGDHRKALECFYKAYILYPDVPAFALNLLQSMCELKQKDYKKVDANALINDLDAITLSDTNLDKLSKIKPMIARF